MLVPLLFDDIVILIVKIKFWHFSRFQNVTFYGDNSKNWL